MKIARPQVRPRLPSVQADAQCDLWVLVGKRVCPVVDAGAYPLTQALRARGQPICICGRVRASGATSVDDSGTGSVVKTAPTALSSETTLEKTLKKLDIILHWVIFPVESSHEPLSSGSRPKRRSRNSRTAPYLDYGVDPVFILSCHRSALRSCVRATSKHWRTPRNCKAPPSRFF